MKVYDNDIHRNTETLFVPETTVRQWTGVLSLADRMPAAAFVPFLIGAVILAIAYGSSFLLADVLRASGREAAEAGNIISIGTIATLAGCAGAGRLAERTGILPLIICSAVMMASAMACFASFGFFGIGFAYAGGLLLGLGWSVFYILAPIQLIHCLKPTARLEALTLLSGSQMLGIGLSAPLGHFLVQGRDQPALIYVCYGLFCIVAAGLMIWAQRALKTIEQLPMTAVALTIPLAAGIVRAGTVFPVIMIGLSACVFSGLSTFQTLYAESRGLSSGTFFLTFTVTTVALRFSVASQIGKLPLGKLVLTLFALTLAGLALLAVNEKSIVLYIAATVLFAIGYGLTYSTLNAMIVNLADERGLSVPVASQVFTIGYFIGAFGFPYIAGGVLRGHGIDRTLLLMMGIVVVNMIVAMTVLRRR